MGFKNPEILNNIKEIVRIDMLNRMREASRWVIMDANQTREYAGFTGNTQTSYAVGIFSKGNLEYIQTTASANVESRTPRRKKVKFGQVVYLSHPFEGDGRAVIGEAHVDDNYGMQTAIENIKDFKNNAGFAMFVTTGTEYSSILEAKQVNVLSGAFGFTDIHIREGFASIPKL